MKTNRLVVNILAIVMVLSGCAYPQVPGSSVAPTISNYPTAAYITETPMPLKATDTPELLLSPTTHITLSPTYQPTDIDATRIISNCLRLEVRPIEQTDSQGVVVFASIDTPYQTYLMDTTTGVLTAMEPSKENWADHSVSPDQKYLAVLVANLETHSTEKISIIDTQGHEVQSVPWIKSEWDQFGGWINNQTLGIILKSTDPEFKLGFAPEPLLALNPFTGESKRINPEFPDIVIPIYISFPQWKGGNRGVSYDPTLTYAVYPIYADSNKEMYTYALFNLFTNQVVTTLNDIFLTYSLYDIYYQPIWSDDGNYFYLLNMKMADDNRSSISVFHEIYKISNTGTYERLTFTNPIFAPEDPNIVLSPNNKLLSIYLDNYGKRETFTRVAWVDESTQETINYCLPITHELQMPVPGVWSPDSTKFLVTDEYQEGHSNVILIDVRNNTATMIAEDLVPVGWMIEP